MSKLYFSNWILYLVNSINICFPLQKTEIPPKGRVCNLIYLEKVDISLQDKVNKLSAPAYLNRYLRGTAGNLVGLYLT